MGSGFKNWGAEVATSGDIDGYLMDQANLHFDSAAARDAALVGRLTDGMQAYCRDINAWYFYDSGITLPAAGVAGWRPWYSQWGAYTPSWTNLTVNNGTVSAAYRWELGKLCCRGKLTFGSSTVITGDVSMALPDSRTGDTYGSTGHAIILDNGTRTYMAQSDVPENGTVINFVHSEGGVITATSPMTWTTGDVLRWYIEVNVTVAG